jgi:hypothetical protein
VYTGEILVLQNGFISCHTLPSIVNTNLIIVSRSENVMYLDSFLFFKVVKHHLSNSHCHEFAKKFNAWKHATNIYICAIIFALKQRNVNWFPRLNFDFFKTSDIKNLTGPNNWWDRLPKNVCCKHCVGYPLSRWTIRRNTKHCRTKEFWVQDTVSEFIIFAIECSKIMCEKNLCFNHWVWQSAR